MAKILTSDALNIAIKKGLVRTFDNYFSNEPVEAYKQATLRIREKQNKYILSQKKDKEE